MYLTSNTRNTKPLTNRQKFNHIKHPVKNQIWRGTNIHRISCLCYIFLIILGNYVTSLHKDSPSNNINYRYSPKISVSWDNERTIYKKREWLAIFVGLQGGSSPVAPDLERSFWKTSRQETDRPESNVNVTTLGVPIASQGVVPSYGSTTPYQIHLYKRRHRGSTGQHITVDTLGRVLVGKLTFNLPAALFHVTNHENDSEYGYPEIFLFVMAV